MDIATESGAGMRRFSLPEGQLSELLSSAYPELFMRSGGIPVEPVQPTGDKAIGGGYRLGRFPVGIRIEYAETADLMRALGTLMAEPALERFEEKPTFSFRGFMLDVSRNGVARIETLERLILRLALLGYNYFCLYTEDTFEVAGHPLIGYRRGRYSKAELHSLDAYAARLGITMFPCIQTLGHLEQVLKHGRYRNLGDNDSVLSVKSADARRLVETLIREASEPYASRLIHVGMDEPWGIGRGRTFEYGKAIDPRALYLDHVSFVAETCEHLGLEPLMWGDVIIGKDEAALTDAQRAAFPANMGLVFWDYYAETGDFYTARIAEYRAMGKEPLCAPGIWNWGSLWPSFRKVRQTLPLFMAEARKAGIRRVLLTAWGDDGQECPLAANWPSLALFAGESWRSGSDDEVWDGGAGGAASMAGAAGFDGDPGARVRALTGLDPELLVRLGDLDLLPGEEGRCGALGKLLLWEDPLAARYSHQLGGITLRGRYAALAGLAGRARMAAESLRSAGGADSARTAHSPRGGADPSPGDPASEPQLLLDYAEALCRVLSDKADFYNDARAAYRAGDRKAMARLSRRLGRLVRSVPRLWQARRALWFLEFRSAGWEVLDLRFGGLMARLETARGRLEAWCSGSLSCLEELEEEPIAEFDSIAIAHPAHRRIHTGSLVQ